jgi:hypothetical protein
MVVGQAAHSEIDVTEDLGVATEFSSRATDAWWARHRLRYNIGLLIAGPLGFVLYAVAVDRCIALHAPGDWEITIFTTAFHGFAYLIMMGVANLCYYLGPWSERFIHPADVIRYRKTTFQLGFWFSVLLPFAPSAILFASCALHAGEDKRILLELFRSTLFSQFCS